MKKILISVSRDGQKTSEWMTESVDMRTCILDLGRKLSEFLEIHPEVHAEKGGAIALTFSKPSRVTWRFKQMN